jgi:hypothetical protein
MDPVQTRGPWTGGPCFVLSRFCFIFYIRLYIIVYINFVILVARLYDFNSHICSYMIYSKTTTLNLSVVSNISESLVLQLAGCIAFIMAELEL